MTNTAEELFQRLCKGERRALAKSITLIESSLEKDEREAIELLNLVSSKKSNSIRLGISGVPGAGKSTFIESFGLYAIALGKKVAVLAVDPSSPITGGSILGDKTRMPELTMNDSAFIRPSPSSGTLGGVARKTRETILLCEAAGYDVIIIETVGVGQSEVAVSRMTDFFVLMLIAGGGDELQGIKKGIVEISDLILINKADTQNETRATLSKNEYKSALHYLSPKYDFWRPEVLTVSALYKKGIDEVWKVISKFITQADEFLHKNRSKQNKKWLWESIENKIHSELEILKKENSRIKEIENLLSQGSTTMRESVSEIISIFKKH
ncbi:MAG: methylmalonyl Co-A mutase-associated GTPase MeaB [Leptospiraceae bacterium]|nr:methylmalonyl Co-A mutase-associated GTPase MeaB [Leptospiraceae bacterium]